MAPNPWGRAEHETPALAKSNPKANGAKGFLKYGGLPQLL